MRKLSRRRFAKGLTVTGMASVFGSASAAGDNGSRIDPKEGVENFRASGKKVTRTKIRPTKVNILENIVSDDLDKRYGRQHVQFTRTLERSDPDSDNLPKRDTRVQRESWEGYYATEVDWKRLYSGEQSSSIRASATGGRNPKELDYSHGVYEYNEDSDGTGYVIVAPMNVLSDDAMSDVKQAATNDHYVGSGILQSDRYAWNSQAEQFEQQHDSIADTIDRTLGGEHARMWEFNGWTSVSAHVDSGYPHEATSFADAEKDLRQTFADASDWSVVDDSVDMNNDEDLPSDAPSNHDGKATQLYQVY